MAKHILVTNDDSVFAPGSLALTDLNTWHWDESSFETALLKDSQTVSLLQ